MLALAAFAALSTPTFEEFSKQNLDLFALAKFGTAEYRLSFQGPEGPKTTLVFRLSKGTKGSVFEAQVDRRKVVRALNDGKTVSVQAIESGLQCRVPASNKLPIDTGLVRLRPKGKDFEVTILGTAEVSQLKGYVWKNTLDKMDYVDGVECRHLSYTGKRGDAPDMIVDAWFDKKAKALKYMTYKIGEANITVGTSFVNSSIALPSGPLAKAIFKGFEPAPLSLVREKIAGGWAPPQERAE